MYLSPDKYIALQRARFGFIGIAFIPIFAYHFILSFLEIRKKLLLAFLYFLYLSSIPTLILSRTDYVYSDIGLYFWGYYPIAGTLYPVFMLIFFISFIWGIALLFLGLIKAKRENNPIRVQQIKYVLLAFACGTTGLADYLIKFGINFYPYGYISALAFISLIAYAIIKYRLLDITLVFRGGLVFLSYITVVSIFIIPLLLLLRDSLGLTILFVVFAAATAPFIYQYLRKRSLSIIDFLFFKGKFDYQEKLAKMPEVIPAIIDRDKLLRYVVHNIASNMRIKKCLIFTKDDYSGNYVIAQDIGLDADSHSKAIEESDPLIVWLKKHRDLQVKYELFQAMSETKASQIWSAVNPFATEVIIPLYKGKNLPGFICLSQKGGGSIFTEEDYKLLKAIANQLVVVVENIRLYNKLIHTDRQTFLETLSSGVSHEMRNRLVAIRTFIDLFPERVKTENVDPSFLEFRELAVREMARLTKIIDGLLSYARAATKGGETFDVTGLLEEALLIIEPKLKEKEITVTTRLNSNHAMVTGDKGRLMQVFINIMQNGIESMDKSGRLEIHTSKANGNIEIKISDTGKGISSEHRDAIFEPFFTTKHTGTGLGLSIVQRIVRDHGGSITVDSEINRGTTFNIILPKKGNYLPGEIKPKKDLAYWRVKREE